MLKESYVSDPKRPKAPQCVYVKYPNGRKELCPSKKLLHDFKVQAAALVAKGKKSRAAHNQAFLDCNYERRFRKQILNNPKAMATLKELSEQAKNTDLCFICYESLDKACHRRILLRICEEKFNAKIEVKGVEPTRSKSTPPF